MDKAGLSRATLRCDNRTRLFSPCRTNHFETLVVAFTLSGMLLFPATVTTRLGSVRLY